MRIDGVLVKWNDDRGFGFIAADSGGEEVFVHVSAFPRVGSRPQVGERLSFEIQTTGDGRKQATAVLRPQRAAEPARRRALRQAPPRLGGVGTVVGLVLVGVVVWAFPGLTQRVGASMQPGAFDAPPVRSESPPAGVPPAATFRCDGRTHCSQMSSCAEATYFLRNCPGVKMDGNGDGVPCEQQWCTGASWR